MCVYFLQGVSVYFLQSQAESAAKKIFSLLQLALWWQLLIFCAACIPSRYSTNLPLSQQQAAGTRAAEGLVATVTLLNQEASQRTNYSLHYFKSILQSYHSFLCDTSLLPAGLGQTFQRRDQNSAGSLSSISMAASLAVASELAK